MTEITVDLADVTVCAPCDQGAQHPESHAAETRYLLEDRCPLGVDDALPVRALVHGVRNGPKVTGPVTVHKGGVCDFDYVTGDPVRSWAATQP